MPKSQQHTRPLLTEQEAFYIYNNATQHHQQHDICEVHGTGGEVALTSSVLQKGNSASVALQTRQQTQKRSRLPQLPQQLQRKTRVSMMKHTQEQQQQGDTGASLPQPCTRTLQTQQQQTHSPQLKQQQLRASIAREGQGKQRRPPRVPTSRVPTQQMEHRCSPAAAETRARLEHRGRELAQRISLTVSKVTEKRRELQPLQHQPRKINEVPTADDKKKQKNAVATAALGLAACQKVVATALRLQPRLLAVAPAITRCRTTRRSSSSRRKEHSSRCGSTINAENTKKNIGPAGVRGSRSLSTSSSSVSSSSGNSGSVQRRPCSYTLLTDLYLPSQASSEYTTIKEKDIPAASVRKKHRQKQQQQLQTNSPTAISHLLARRTPAADVVHQQQPIVKHADDKYQHQGHEEISVAVHVSAESFDCMISPDSVCAAALSVNKDDRSTTPAQAVAFLTPSEMCLLKKTPQTSAHETSCMQSPSVELHHLQIDGDYDEQQQQQQCDWRQLHLLQSLHDIEGTTHAALTCAAKERTTVTYEAVHARATAGDSTGLAVVGTEEPSAASKSVEETPANIVSEAEEIRDAVPQAGVHDTFCTPRTKSCKLHMLCPEGATAAAAGEGAGGEEEPVAPALTDHQGAYPVLTASSRETFDTMCDQPLCDVRIVGSPTSVSEHLRPVIDESTGVGVVAAVAGHLSLEGKNSEFPLANSAAHYSQVVASHEGLSAEPEDRSDAETAIVRKDCPNYAPQSVAIAGASAHAVTANGLALCASRETTSDSVVAGKMGVGAYPRLPPHVQRLLRHAAALQPYIDKFESEQQRTAIQHSSEGDKSLLSEDVPQHSWQEKQKTRQGLQCVLLRAFRCWWLPETVARHGDLTISTAGPAIEKVSTDVAERKTVFEEGQATAAAADTATQMCIERSTTEASRREDPEAAVSRKNRAAVAARCTNKNIASRSGNQSPDALNVTTASPVEQTAAAGEKDKLQSSCGEDFYVAAAALLDVISLLLEALQHERSLLLQPDDYFFRCSQDRRRQQHALVDEAAADYEGQQEDRRRGRLVLLSNCWVLRLLQELKRQQRALLQTKRELAAEQQRRRRLSSLLVQAQHAIRQQELLNDKLKKRLLSSWACRTGTPRPVQFQKFSVCASHAEGVGAPSLRATTAAHATVRAARTRNRPTAVAAAAETHASPSSTQDTAAAKRAASAAKTDSKCKATGAEDALFEAARREAQVAESRSMSVVCDVDRRQCRCACNSAKQQLDSKSLCSSLNAERAAFEIALDGCYAREVELLRALRQQHELIVTLQSEVQSATDKVPLYGKDGTEQLHTLQQEIDGHKYVQSVQDRQRCDQNRRLRRRQQQQHRHQRPERSPSEEEGDQHKKRQEINTSQFIELKQKQQETQKHSIDRSEVGQAVVCSDAAYRRHSSQLHGMAYDTHRYTVEQQRHREQLRHPRVRDLSRESTEGRVSQFSRRSTEEAKEDGRGDECVFDATRESSICGSGSDCERRSGTSGNNQGMRARSGSKEDRTTSCRKSKIEKRRGQLRRQRNKKTLVNSSDGVPQGAAGGLPLQCHTEKSADAAPQQRAAKVEEQREGEFRLAAAAPLFDMWTRKDTENHRAGDSTVHTRVTTGSNSSTHSTSCSPLIVASPVTTASSPGATYGSSTPTITGASSSPMRVREPAAATKAHADAVLQTPAAQVCPIKHASATLQPYELKNSGRGEAIRSSVVSSTRSPANPSPGGHASLTSTHAAGCFGTVVHTGVLTSASNTQTRRRPANNRQEQIHSGGHVDFSLDVGVGFPFNESVEAKNLIIERLSSAAPSAASCLPHFESPARPEEASLNVFSSTEIFKAAKKNMLLFDSNSFPTSVNA